MSNGATPELRECFRCHQTDGLWVAESPSVPQEIRYSVECVCGLSGAPRSNPAMAIQWWNKREGAEPSKAVAR